MTRIILVAAMIAASTVVAHADPMTGMYGNTLKMTGADGKSSTVYVNQDMSWEQHMADASTIKGTWMWKDATTACFTQTDPAPKPDMKPYCTVINPHNAGDTWDEKDAQGKVMMSYSLSAGR
ncbi:MAG TPA: hypothetical protein VLV55_11885 [Rhizomicrobium sp.]|nr:hypothetical protein [Rhizomicrobium sp.]